MRIQLIVGLRRPCISVSSLLPISWLTDLELLVLPHLTPRITLSSLELYFGDIIILCFARKSPKKFGPGNKFWSFWSISPSTRWKPTIFLIHSRWRLVYSRVYSLTKTVYFIKSSPSLCKVLHWYHFQIVRTPISIIGLMRKAEKKIKHVNKHFFDKI